MKTDKPIHQMLQLWRHISKRRRTQFAYLLGLTVISSFAEILSLGAVLPFIGILTQPEQVYKLPYISEIAQVLGINSGPELITPLAIAFAIAALVAGGVRLLLLYVSVRLANATGADLSVEVYRRTLYQPYAVHVARSSSEIISGITQKVGTATSVMISIVTVITAAVLFIAILSTLLIVDPVVAIVAALSFGVAYGMIAWVSRHRLIFNSQRTASEQTKVVKALQEGLGAIRDVLLDGAQKEYCGVYRQSVDQLQRAASENAFINQAPRYAMESLGMALIAAFVVAVNYRSGGVAAALPILGMLAIGAQRLLPLMQQLYGNWSVIAGSKAALVDVLALLDQPLPAEADLPETEPYMLGNGINFDNVFFRYNNTGPWVLNGFNLEIAKGARIGFVGSTGSGKSTALDILMGLLDPTQGRVLVDGHPVGRELKRKWQRTIAHVPQNIFLTDATIAENIAFGVPPHNIDHERVRSAAEQAKIAEFIESRPDGYNAAVGERGVRLSGGQRQRIGIARALYKKASVLVFDEATSALDGSTESAVMEAIENLDTDLTVLIIAHRIATLARCDSIVKLEGGRVVSISNYEELVNNQH